ncbi:hypothetical protein HDU80_011754 [Chytriomyces hyalinus]|nr:hypothetical protein HDU80_011754 [Chytriomyces hyalinus]
MKLIQTDWGVALVVVVIDAVISTIFAIVMRSAVDTDRNGTISVEEAEAERLESSQRPSAVVAVGTSLYDFGTIPLITVLLNSWAFAAAYGLVAVLTCNALLPSIGSSNVPGFAGWDWIITLYLSFASLLFMCAFCNNGIHMATSHAVHFVYYACGFAPMALYVRLPAGWIVALVVATRLGMFVGIKMFVWPNFPQFYELDPIFKRSSDPDAHLIVFSTPETVRQDPELRKTLDTVSIEVVTTLHIPFPIYEIININIASYFTWGAVLGWAVVLTALRVTQSQTRTVDVGLALGVTAAVTAGVGVLAVFVFPSLPERSKWKTLERYYPRVSALFALFVGAGLVSTHLATKWGGFSASIPVGVFVVTHGLHVVALFLYVFGYAAVVRYFGWGASLRRMFPVKAGNGGVFMRKEVLQETSADLLTSPRYQPV